MKFWTIIFCVFVVLVNVFIWGKVIKKLVDRPKAAVVEVGDGIHL